MPNDDTVTNTEQLEKEQAPSRSHHPSRQNRHTLQRTRQKLPGQTAGSLPLYDLSAGSCSRSHPVCR